MFQITSRDRTTGRMRIEETLGTHSLREANLALKRLEDRWPDKEMFLTMCSRSDDFGNRYFPVTTDGNTYKFAM